MSAGNVRYVEYLMPVLVEVNVPNKEITQVIEFPEYIKPTGAVFDSDRVTVLRADTVEHRQAIELAEATDTNPWPPRTRLDPVWPDRKGDDD